MVSNVDMLERQRVGSVKDVKELIFLVQLIAKLIPVTFEGPRSLRLKRKVNPCSFLYLTTLVASRTLKKVLWLNELTKSEFGFTLHQKSGKIWHSRLHYQTTTETSAMHQSNKSQ